MIIQELVENTTLQEIHEALVSIYPQEAGRVSEGVYDRLWRELKEITPVENTNHMTLHVENLKKEETKEEHVWSTGYSTDLRYHHKYNLQYASKEEILAFEINPDDLNTLSAGSYLAHVFFDIAREGQMEEVYEEFQCVNPPQPSITRGFIDRQDIDYLNVEQVMKEIDEEGDFTD